MTSFFSFLFNLLLLILFSPLLFEKNNYIVSRITFFNYLFQDQTIHSYIVCSFIIFSFLSSIILFYSFVSIIIPKQLETNIVNKVPVFGLLIGKDKNNKNVFIPEKSLYQNILIIGSIGSGKTSSAMYPFTKQLIKYECHNSLKKLGFLVLDVKGNYYSKVLSFATEFGRLNDVIVIEINGKYTYNPLDKPLLKSSVLANRIKNILTLFSPNNSESYWLDKVEQIIEASINLCRIYNNNYVSFDEIHKLVTNYLYYSNKVQAIKSKFQANNLSQKDCYILFNSITFLDNDYYSLDSRTYNLLKSEITRITNFFVADYEINKTFCPPKSKVTFRGFKDVLENGKIVVLNMNIAKYKNMSKIIATYLKLDFQSEVLSQLSNSSSIERSTVFISDEYQEYVTSSDADFFSQSRESKCINIVSTQSYSSIINSLNNNNASKVIIQNLINKLWFRTEDIFTIEEIQKQIGKEEKSKFSKTISENSKNSFYSPLSKDFFSTGSSLSESINSYTQSDFVYDYKFFTQKLSTFSCLSFLSDGEKILPPSRLNMIPYFRDNT